MIKRVYKAEARDFKFELIPYGPVAFMELREDSTETIPWSEIDMLYKSRCY